jgi:uncharacterized protein YwqG
LVPDGDGRSRLGGLPEIPGAWPLNDGRGLTHLASIALDELPDFPGRSQLPTDGTLVFFADFSEESEGWGPAVGNDSVIALVHVPPGADTAPAVPPEETRDDYAVPVVLTERRVRFEPVLTMKLDFNFELPDALDEAYSDFGEALATPDHLLLGEPVYLQGDPREPGELSLFQMNWDDDLDFVYGDGGQISFYGTAEDISGGRWHRIRVTPESS